MAKWKLKTAKAQLSEVVRCARAEGPQEVTVRGKSAVYLVSSEDYRSLVAPRTKGDLFGRLRRAAGGLELEFPRDQEDSRPDFTL